MMVNLSNVLDMWTAIYFQVSYSSFHRRTGKWWKKVFFHVISLVIVNAYILYKEWCTREGTPAMKQRVFRRTFVKEVMMDYPPPPRRRKGGKPSAGAEAGMFITFLFFACV